MATNTKPSMVISHNRDPSLNALIAPVSEWRLAAEQCFACPAIAAVPPIVSLFCFPNQEEHDRKSLVQNVEKYINPLLPSFAACPASFCILRHFPVSLIILTISLLTMIMDTLQEIPQAVIAGIPISTLATDETSSERTSRLQLPDSIWLDNQPGMENAVGMLTPDDTEANFESACMDALLNWSSTYNMGYHDGYEAAMASMRQATVEEISTSPTSTESTPDKPDSSGSEQRYSSPTQLDISTMNRNQDDSDFYDASASMGRGFSSLSTPPSTRRRRDIRRKNTRRYQRREFKVMAKVSKVYLDGSALVWKPSSTEVSDEEVAGLWISDDGETTYEWEELMLSLGFLRADVIPNLSPVTYKAKWNDSLETFQGADPLKEFTLTISKDTLSDMLCEGKSQVEVVLAANKAKTGGRRGRFRPLRE